jgi:hypothetical protein
MLDLVACVRQSGASTVEISYFVAIFGNVDGFFGEFYVAVVVAEDAERYYVLFDMGEFLSRCGVDGEAWFVHFALSVRYDGRAVWLEGSKALKVWAVVGGLGFVLHEAVDGAATVSNAVG